MSLPRFCGGIFGDATMRPTAACAALIACALATAGPAAATTTITDLLPTYAGPAGVDLDVIKAGVAFDPRSRNLTFRATLGGRIGTTPGAIYVFGLDRGAGTANFVAGVPSIGQGVLFDSALVVNSDGSGIFNDLLNVRVTPLAPGAVRIRGANLTVTLAAHLVPPAGQPIPRWTFNVWPRVGLGDNSQIADFAPDAMNAPINLVDSSRPASRP